MTELKLKYNESLKSNLFHEESKKEKGYSREIEFYVDPGRTRTICFVLAEGKQIFLNYTYLVFGEYIHEESKILLTFTTHSVILKGTKMDDLFDQIIEQRIKKIAEENERYSNLSNDFASKVNSIVVDLINQE